MKLPLTLVIVALFTFSSHAQEEPSEEYLRLIDSIEQEYTYRYDTVELQNGIGKIIVPPGFKYLDAMQAQQVLLDLWGNPYYEVKTLEFFSFGCS